MTPGFLSRDMASRALPIRILVADDSVVARAILSRVIGLHDDFTLIAAVSNGHEVLPYIQDQSVDILILDIEMPGLSGLELLPLIQQNTHVRTLILSSSASEGAVVTLEALALGATDTLQKPGSGFASDHFQEELVRKLRHITAIGTEGKAAAPYQPLFISKTQPERMSEIACLAIGSSTGGIHALNQFLPQLVDQKLPPILLTQHLPDSFMPYFARQVQAMAQRPAKVAEEGDQLIDGHIYIAPGDGHLKLVATAYGAPRITLDRTVAHNLHMPCVDIMLDAMADLYGASALAIILSGMGRDGSLGAAKMHRLGADVIVQDVNTSVVWGMPGSVAEKGIAKAVLPPPALAEWVISRLKAAWN